MKLKVLAIIGSASSLSSNEKIVRKLATVMESRWETTIFNTLQSLPHFAAEQTLENTPAAIIEIREKIASADGILICTPEYIFSIPSGLKNLLEWCVATTVFSDKPVGIITASAHGEMGHAALKMLLKTVDAKTNEDASLLIQGVKGKIDSEGIIAATTQQQLLEFAQAFTHLMNKELVC